MYARKVQLGLAVVTAATLALVGCSSSSKGGGSSSTGSTSTGGGGSTAPSKPATGSPIVLGNVGTYSGPIGSSNTATVPMLNAWVKQVNAAGGINGHPVKIVTADDQTSPSENLTAVENQVSNSKVVAFLSNMVEATAPAAQKYLESKQIPVIGGDQNLPTWYQSPMYFATGAAASVMNYAQMKVAQDSGIKKLAIWYCTDSPTCLIFAKQQQAAAKSLGLAVTGLQPISLAQPSFTAPCLAAKSKGADGVVPNTDPSTFQRIAKGCQSVGYSPTYTTSTNSIDSGYTSLPGSTKTVGVTQQFPYFVTSGSPALQAYNSIFQGLSSTQKNSSAAQTWTAIQLFEAAAKAGVPSGGTPTSADILKGLYSLKADTLGGLTVPLTFTKGQPSPVGNCWFTASFGSGKFSNPSGLTAACTSKKIGLNG